MPDNTMNMPRTFDPPGAWLRVISAVAAAAALAGCASPFRPVATEAELARITPGMTREEVIARVGRPTWTFRVRQEDLTVLNYRYSHYACTVYQISIRPDGIVRDAATGYDPACDGPRERL